MKKFKKEIILILVLVLIICAGITLYFITHRCNDVDTNINTNNNNGLYLDDRILYPNAKPIIYLYPKEETKLTVKLGYPEKLICSYPQYINEWNITSYPDGTIIDNTTNRKLYSLYWEGNNFNTQMTNEGFVVKKEDTINFLEEKLELLGLSYKEAEEFIIYWLPILQKSEYNYIRFSSLEEINNYMPLEFSVKPDSLIRVHMVFKHLDDYIEVKEQKLLAPSRNGFVAVEWGGTEIK